jgi:hypothetical protein
MGGYSLAHAMMLIPEAWAGNPLMDDKRRAFYEYHAALMEPWDGPAAVAFTDGRQIGATLDRNGLRPARYIVTDDDDVIMSSEVGVLPVPPEKIVKKWRLQPGKMLLIDLEQGRIISDDEIKRRAVHRQPYKDWLHRPRSTWRTAGGRADGAVAGESLLDRQQAFGYTQEDIKLPDDARWRPSARKPSAPWAPTRRLGAVDKSLQAALHLFQAELRAGHQPADRPDPRGAGDEPGVVHRTAPEPVRPRRACPPPNAWRCVSRS